MLLAHVGIATYQSWRDSPTWDEMGHFAAGISHWRYGTFNLYRVNPPLVRIVATAPAALWMDDVRADFRNRQFSRDRSERPEFASAPDVARANGARYFTLISIARLMCLPFSILGGMTCFLWARELHGNAGGLVAVALWSFSPTTLAYGHLITPDVAAASLGLLACYCLRRWLRVPTLPAASWAGITLGLALLAKSTWAFLVLLWPGIWLTWRLLRHPRPIARQWGREAAHFLPMFGLSLLVLNLGYSFEGTGRPLGDYKFVSATFSGRGTTTPGNQFTGSLIGKLPVPLPENYVLGIDYLKMEYERKYWSYLRGEWRMGGWSYYYVYALLLKEPIGLWLLVLVAAALALVRPQRYWTGWQEEILLAVPATVVLALVSSQTGFNHHVRYVLPVLPFVFIWAARVGRAIAERRAVVTAGCVAALVWAVGSSLAAVPHSLSYFNEAAGGPRGGHRHLSNSNTDWGQDLLYVRDWYLAHPEARPFHLGYSLTLLDPSLAGIDWQPLPEGPAAPAAIAGHIAPEKLGPRPGWYVVSVNLRHSFDRRFEYFAGFEPVDFIGFSHVVYRISPNEADDFRRSHGLPPLGATRVPAPPPSRGDQQ